MKRHKKAMEIHSLEKQTTCKHFAEDQKTGFVIINLSKNKNYSFDNRSNTIIFLLEGTVTINYGKAENINIKSGNMFLIPQDVSHCVYAMEGASGVQLHIDSDFELFQNISTVYKAQEAMDTEHPFNSLKMHSFIINLLYQIKEYIQEELLCEQIQELKQKELLILLFAYYERKDIISFFTPILCSTSSFRELVINHWENVTSITDLADKLFMSRSTFIRHFKSAFGETPYQWIIRKKAANISKELKNSNDSISNIADKYNFSSLSQFSNFCKRYLGKAPSHIRDKTQLLSEKPQKTDADG